jgi:hypothetical protein
MYAEKKLQDVEKVRQKAEQRHAEALNKVQQLTEDKQRLQVDLAKERQAKE